MRRSLEQAEPLVYLTLKLGHIYPLLVWSIVSTCAMLIWSKTKKKKIVHACKHPGGFSDHKQSKLSHYFDEAVRWTKWNGQNSQINFFSKLNQKIIYEVTLASTIFGGESYLDFCPVRKESKKRTLWGCSWVTMPPITKQPPISMASTPHRNLWSVASSSYNLLKGNFSVSQC